MIRARAYLYALFLDFFKHVISYDSLEDLSDYSKLRGRLYKRALHWYIWLLRRIAREDRACIEAIQYVRLRKLLRRAALTPYWRKNIVSTSGASLPSILQKIPIQTRSELRSVPKELLITGYAKRIREKIVWRLTSGSTGEPFVWGFDPRVLWMDWTAYFLQAASEYGYTFKTGAKKDICILNFIDSTSHPVAPVAIPCTWSPHSQRSDDELERVHATIESMDSPILFTYASDVWLLTQALKKRGTAPALGLIITTGQALEPEIRALAEEYFGCRVHSIYSSREIVEIAFECTQHPGRLHVNEARVALEIVDEARNTAPPGVWGDIVVTSLDNHAFPLIRYRMSDTGRLLEGPCTCGINLVSLEIKGRDIEFIEFPNGDRIAFREVSVIILDTIFRRIRFYQVRQEKDGLKIFIVPEGAVLEEATMRMFMERLYAIVGSLPITVEYVSEIAKIGGKFKRFVPLSETN